jgi:F0F1-type ATP synthase alpha subunit
MKKVPNKIILNLLLILLLNGCHTLQHNGFQDKIPKKETKNIIYNNFKTSSKNSKIEKETTEEVTQKLNKNSELENLKKQKKSRQEKFNLTSILKLSETDLLKRLGVSDFVKFEGKLKNHQYYFSKCFLDVFVIKKENDYYVNFFETRPIKLNGTLKKEECLQDINTKLNITKN